MKYKQKSRKRVHPKRTKEFYKRKKTYGARKKPIKNFNYYWAMDIPNHYPNAPRLNIFKDKCLLTATVLGLLQNQYFKSNRRDRRYLYAQNINSVNKVKQARAGQIILSELNNIIDSLNLPLNGPYELEETTKKLNTECKEYLDKNLKKMNYSFIPSYTNFVIFPINMNGKDFLSKMTSNSSPIFSAAILSKADILRAVF